MKKGKICSEDLFRLNLFSDTVLNPDGIVIVFGSNHIDLNKNRNLSHHYLADLESGSVEQITYGEVIDILACPL